MKKNTDIYKTLLLAMIIFVMAFINNCGDSQSSALTGKWVAYDYNLGSSASDDIELFSDKTFKTGYLSGSWTTLEDSRLKLTGGQMVILFSLKDGYLIGLDNPFKYIRYAKAAKDKDMLYYLKQNLSGTWELTEKKELNFIFKEDGSLIIKHKPTGKEQKNKYNIATEQRSIVLNVSGDEKFTAQLQKLSKDDLVFGIEHGKNLDKQLEVLKFKRISLTQGVPSHADDKLLSVKKLIVGKWEQGSVKDFPQVLEFLANGILIGPGGDKGTYNIEHNNDVYRLLLKDSKGEGPSIVFDVSKDTFTLYPPSWLPESERKRIPATYTVKKVTYERTK